MGKLRGNSLFEFVGTVGDQVGFIRNGKHYVRSKPKRRRDANTPQQAAHRSRFKGVICLAKEIKELVIHPIWQLEAYHMSGHNFFVKQNIAAFDSDEHVTDYGMLQMSRGELLNGVLSMVATDGVACSVTINWSEDWWRSPTSSPDDLLRLLVIKEGEKPILLSTTYERSVGTGVFKIPFDSGDTVHLYAFFEDKTREKHSMDFYQAVVLG